MVPPVPLLLLRLGDFTKFTPTIPHQLRSSSARTGTRFQNGLADSADESGRKRSNVYEINQWLWQFGRV